MSLSARLVLLRFFRPASPDLAPAPRVEPRIVPRLSVAGRPRKGPAKGVPDRSNPATRTIVVRVDDATFGRIESAASMAGITTSEAIRQLIARGLDTREG